MSNMRPNLKDSKRFKNKPLVSNDHNPSCLKPSYQGLPKQKCKKSTNLLSSQMLVDLHILEIPASLKEMFLEKDCIQKIS